ncbi:MAG: Holliday junction branch migration protein RuvA [Pseudomonadota bacterium]
MISFVKGILAAKEAPFVVVDVNGLGYEIETPLSTFLNLPKIGAMVQLTTHFVVREDAQRLYGFESQAERVLFVSLLKVSGIGARIALAVLSSMSVAGFQQCVAHEDVAALVKIPGIGRKTAQRLIVEMRDKLNDTIPKLSPTKTTAPMDSRTEAAQALQALGYKEAEVTRLLDSVSGSADSDSAEDLIRLALRAAAG